MAYFNISCLFRSGYVRIDSSWRVGCGLDSWSMGTNITFVVAMRYEIENIFNINDFNLVSDFIFPVLMHKRKNICIVESGIGKVNAASATEFVLFQTNPNRIINVGTSGSLDQSVPIGSVCQVEKVKFFDVDVTAFGYKLGQVPKTEVHEYPLSHKYFSSLNKFGVLTGDTFVSSRTLINKLRKEIEYKLVDMELGSIAHVCYRHSKSGLLSSFKAPSDYSNSEASRDFYKNEKLAFSNLKKFINQIIEK